MSLPSDPKHTLPQSCSEQLLQTRSVQLEGSPDSTSTETVKTKTTNVLSINEMDTVASHDTFHYEDRVCDSSSLPRRTFEKLGLKLENTTLSEKEKHQFKNIVEQFNDVFAHDNSELTGCILGSLKLRPKNVEIKPFRARFILRAQSTD